MKACLGLDTSCYTTSIALCCLGDSAADGLFFQARKLLDVELGARGLMQSEAVFQHINAAPALMERLLSEHPGAKVAAVCASVRPRPAEDSYMPVFRVGESLGRSVAASLRVPFFQATHQQGHLRAARVDTGLDADKPYLALHLSGGTTELLYVERDTVKRLGGSCDLHAGQLIDRTGVAMGMPFPSGPALEALALTGTASSRLPATVRGLDCHFSGAESCALRWLEAGTLSHADIAAEVFSCVARTVAKLVLAGCRETGVWDVLLGGGVISSAFIRKELSARAAARSRAAALHYSRPDLAGDNAVGVAMLGAGYYSKYKGEGKWQPY